MKKNISLIPVVVACICACAVSAFAMSPRFDDGPVVHGQFQEQQDMTRMIILHSIIQK